MWRVLTLALLLVAGVAHAQVKQEDRLSHFGCGATPACDLKCWGPGGTTIQVEYREAYVYQFKEHPRRLWLSVDGRRYVLGDSETCQFGNPPTVPINPPPPQCTCIGGVCNPPGCDKK
jgi:hypothetical protein